jgi:hypothetical protein
VPQTQKAALFACGKQSQAEKQRGVHCFIGEDGEWSIPTIVKHINNLLDGTFHEGGYSGKPLRRKSMAGGAGGSPGGSGPMGAKSMIGNMSMGGMGGGPIGGMGSGPIGGMGGMGGPIGGMGPMGGMGSMGMSGGMGTMGGGTGLGMSWGPMGGNGNLGGQPMGSPILGSPSGSPTGCTMMSSSHINALGSGTLSPALASAGSQLIGTGMGGAPQMMTTSAGMGGAPSMMNGGQFMQPAPQQGAMHGVPLVCPEMKRAGLYLDLE